MPATLHPAQVLCRDEAVRDARARFCDACLPAHYDPLDVWPVQTKAHHCPENPWTPPVPQNTCPTKPTGLRC